MMTESTTVIHGAMIDARTIARVGGWAVQAESLAIIEALSPLVDGWLPEGVVRENGKIVILPR